jgi:DNA modification methylase
LSKIEVYQGDVLEQMRKLEDKSIDSITCSPPYWMLRNYKWEGQWGMESDFRDYLKHLQEFMKEAYRVIKDQGTVFVNLADTYSTQGGQNRGKAYEYDKYKLNNRELGTEMIKGDTGYPDKSLLLIPHRFAIDCMDNGWIVRNDIVWSAFNKMPESAKDRFARKKEYFFFFTKQKKYFFDLDAIRNKPVIQEKRKERIQYKSSKNDESGRSAKFLPPNPKGKNPGDVIDYWEDIMELDNMPDIIDVPTKASKEEHFAMYNEKLVEYFIKAGCPKGGVVLDPFCGTGTTLFTARKLGRNAIGIEGKKEYVDIINKKLKEPNLFNLMGENK